MKEKNNFGKSILKVIIIIVLFTVIVLVSITMRKFLIISKLEKLLSEMDNVDNYLRTAISVNTELGQVIEVTSYIKDNKYLSVGNIYENGNNKSKISSYNDGIDMIGIFEQDGERSTTINGVNSGSTTIAVAEEFKINELDKVEYGYFKNPNNFFRLKILTDVCNSKECYLIQNNNNKYWIDKETGMIIRRMYETGSIEDYRYEIGNVKDSDIIKPEI